MLLCNLPARPLYAARVICKHYSDYGTIYQRHFYDRWAITLRFTTPKPWHFVAATSNHAMASFLAFPPQVTYEITL